MLVVCLCSSYISQSFSKTAIGHEISTTYLLSFGITLKDVFDLEFHLE